MLDAGRIDFHVNRILTDTIVAYTGLTVSLIYLPLKAHYLAIIFTRHTYVS